MIFASTVASAFSAVSLQNEYTLVGNDIKCPYESSTRLFRTDDDDPKSLNECYEICYNTAGCNYFSIGTSRHIGICIGCTGEANLEAERGIDSYELTVTRENFPSSSPIAASSCLEDGDTFTANGCDYDSFVQGLDDFLTGDCGDHDARAVLLSLFPESSEYTVNGICADGWNQVPTSTFRDVDDRFDNAFMEEYIKGNTFLNHETGTFQGTTEGTNIDNFYNAQADNTVVQAIPSLSTCVNNAIMCCFGRDRQPNDNNGNCADPIESRCIDADPADNSNLCYTDTDIPTFDDPFAFPNTSEGPIHCHGLAWGDDENSFETQLRFNNFFYVSLYDHMYTRGYVERTVDSDNIGMCDCVENMPPVSRADCTELDVTQTFTITYRDGSFVADKTGDMDVNFNSCNGIDPSSPDDFPIRENNDLASYVYRLYKDGKVSHDTKNKVFETLVGYANPNDNQNEAACEATYEETFLEAYPYDVEGMKCPYEDPERLFKTENSTTLEECQALCYETQFCQYFSIGVNPSDEHMGICIGCTADAVLERHWGFNTYEMTSTQTFPTASPTPESEHFDAIGTNKKCPFDTRLFRTPDYEPLTRLECYDFCYNTIGCEYFSIGEDAADFEHKGVCMGCTADSVLSDHVGFNAYVMEIKKDDPSSAPSPDTGHLYELAESNKKCSFQNRLFRTDDNDPLTKSECYEMCMNEPTCEYFTLGESDNLKIDWQGLCMGCAGGATLSSHTGFNTYQLI